jgi:hypothetical protein
LVLVVKAAICAPGKGRDRHGGYRAIHGHLVMHLLLCLSSNRIVRHYIDSDTKMVLNGAERDW